LEGAAGETARAANNAIRRLPQGRVRLPVLHASAAEAAQHSAWLDKLDVSSGGLCVWKRLEN